MTSLRNALSATVVYVAFVVDVFSRVIVGWPAATGKRTDLVLGALDMALWRRDQDGHPPPAGLIHHSDAGSQAEFGGPKQRSYLDHGRTDPAGPSRSGSGPDRRSGFLATFACSKQTCSDQSEG